MSTQRPTISPEAVASHMSFDYSGLSPQAATATHDTTVEGVEYRIERIVDMDAETNRITVERRGFADGDVVYDRTTHIASLTEAATRDDVPGEPLTLVGLVTALHYHPLPSDQLSALVYAHTTDST